jgi:hypothetical protein
MWLLLIGALTSILTPHLKPELAPHEKPEATPTEQVDQR